MHDFANNAKFFIASFFNGRRSVGEGGTGTRHSLGTIQQRQNPSRSVSISSRKRRFTMNDKENQENALDAESNHPDGPNWKYRKLENGEVRGSNFEPKEGDVPVRNTSPADLPVGAENAGQVVPTRSLRLQPEVVYTPQLNLKVSTVEPIKRDGVRTRGRPRKLHSPEQKQPEVPSAPQEEEQEQEQPVHQKFDMRVGRAEKDEVIEMEEEQYAKLKQKFMKKSRRRTIAVKGKKEEPQNADEAPVPEKADSYEVERILTKLRTARSDYDKVFIVLWKNWNLTTCTMASMHDLKASPDMLALFSAYQQTKWNVIGSYKKSATPAKEHRLRLIAKTDEHWLTDDQWKVEKKNKEKFKKKYGIWAWIELSRVWNQVDRDNNPDGEHFPIYLEAFHDEAELPDTFEYVSRNVVSPAAQLVLDAVDSTRPVGCTCTCHRTCADCQALMTEHEPCRLQKNGRLHIFQRVGIDSRSFETLICKGACSRTDEDKCCLPRRQCPLLVAWRPTVKGVGVYATEQIPRFKVICEYTGHMISQTEADDGRPTNYQFSVPGVDLVIDAVDMGNEARFINHSCEPNCGLLVLHEESTRAVPRLYIITIKKIGQGEELLLDYHPSYSYDENKERPPNSSTCICGTGSCRTFV